MLGNLISGFIVIMVGVTLAPTVATTVQGSLTNASGGTGGVNITGASATVMGLTTMFYCLAVASSGIGIAIVGLRNSGLM